MVTALSAAYLRSSWCDVKEHVVSIIVFCGMQDRLCFQPSRCRRESFPLAHSYSIIPRARWQCRCLRIDNRACEPWGKKIQDRCWMAMDRPNRCELRKSWCWTGKASRWLPQAVPCYIRRRHRCRYGNAVVNVGMIWRRGVRLPISSQAWQHSSLSVPRNLDPALLTPMNGSLFIFTTGSWLFLVLKDFLMGMNDNTRSICYSQKFLCFACQWYNKETHSS